MEEDYNRLHQSLAEPRTGNMPNPIPISTLRGLFVILACGGAASVVKFIEEDCVSGERACDGFTDLSYIGLAASSLVTTAFVHYHNMINVAKYTRGLLSYRALILA